MTSSLHLAKAVILPLVAAASMVVLQGCAGFTQQRTGSGLRTQTSSARTSSASSGNGLFSRFRSGSSIATSRATAASASSGAPISASSQRAIQFPPRSGQASSFQGGVNAVSQPRFEDLGSGTFRVPEQQNLTRSSSFATPVQSGFSDPSFVDLGPATGGALISDDAGYTMEPPLVGGGAAGSWNAGAPPPVAALSSIISVTDGSTTVRKGDNLTKIAKRHGVSVRQLKSWNNLKSDKIRIGQTLRLEGGSASAFVEPASIKNVPVTAPAPRRSSGGPKRANGISGPEYVVAKGDSLSEIAYKFGIKVADLKAANSLTSDRIDIDWVLTVPNPSKAPALPARVTTKPGADGQTTARTFPVIPDPVLPALPVAPIPAKLAPSGGTSTSAAGSSSGGSSTFGGSQGLFPYKVLAGDSIKQIALTFITTEDQIRAYNPGLKEPLTPGMTIKIPPLK